MPFEDDLEQLRSMGAMHGSLRKDEPEWPEFAEAVRNVATQIPGVDAEKVVRKVESDLSRTWQESAMPLDRVAVGAILSAATDSRSPECGSYYDAAQRVYQDVKRSLF